jgi:hypothetical protein
MKNASHPQLFCDLDEHCRVVDKGDLLSAWARSSARRKMPTSGLRMRTKREEMKESANWSSLNARLRCALTSRDSLLTTTIAAKQPWQAVHTVDSIQETQSKG